MFYIIFWLSCRGPHVDTKHYTTNKIVVIETMLYNIIIYLRILPPLLMRNKSYFAIIDYAFFFRYNTDIVYGFGNKEKSFF